MRTRAMFQLTARRASRWAAPALLAALMAGCATQADVFEKHLRSEDAKPADAALTLDVTFARAPDHDPKSDVYGAGQRIEYSGYPSIDVPFYRKGLGFELGVLGDPRVLLALPYPSPKTDSALARLKIFGQRLDARHYRFLVLPRPGWRSLDSFQVSFTVNGRREGMTFAYSAQAVCDSSFDVTTPTYGFGMSVSASFPGGKPGCLKACDARPGYPGHCAFFSDFETVSGL